MLCSDNLHETREEIWGTLSGHCPTLSVAGLCFEALPSSFDQLYVRVLTVERPWHDSRIQENSDQLAGLSYRSTEYPYHSI